MWTFLKAILKDGNKESYGRTMATPFLIASLLALAASVVRGLILKESIIEDAATMAGIGFSLFTGSKYLSIKGKSVEVEQQSREE